MQSIRNVVARLAAALAAGISCALLIAAPAQATTVLPLYLDEVIDRAATAFEGTCTESHSARDPVTNMIVTYTTFAVRDALKGSVGTTHTIKQIGGTLPGENLEFRAIDVPKFTVGQDYVVFLPGVSRLGFSSPVGLGQGKFTITATAAGRQVGNGRDFRDFASHMSAHAPAQAKALLGQGGPVRMMDLDSFKQMVRGRVGATQ